MAGILAAQVQDVHCTNCGPDFWTELAAVGTLVGLVIAVVALVVALKALKITRDQFDMAKDEHAHFLRELGAQARLTATLDLGRDPDPAGYVRVDATTVDFRARLTIANDGDRNAGRTSVEVFVPLLVTDMRFGWQDDGGLPLDAKPYSTQTRPDQRVKLDDGEGTEHETRRLARDLDEVAAGVPVVLPLQVPVPIPDQGIVVPYLIRVSAERAAGPLEVRGSIRVARPDRLGGVTRA